MLNPPCNCIDPQPETCAACSAVLQMPTPAAIAQAMRSLPAGRALDKAAWHLLRGIEIVCVPGGLLVPGSKGDVWRVSADGSCSCPATGLCYHQMIVRIIEEAHARPSLSTLPDVETTLAWAERLVEQPVLLDLSAKRKVAALATESINELFA